MVQLIRSKFWCLESDIWSKLVRSKFLIRDYHSIFVKRSFSKLCYYVEGVNVFVCVTFCPINGWRGLTKRKSIIVFSYPSWTFALYLCESFFLGLCSYGVLWEMDTSRRSHRSFHLSWKGSSNTSRRLFSTRMYHNHHWIRQDTYVKWGDSCSFSIIAIHTV